MTAHTHWRVNVTATGTTDAYFTSIAEIEFLSASGAIPIAGASFSASSTEHNGVDAAKAFDGNASTLWASAATAGTAGPAYIGAQFSTAVDVASLVLTAGNSALRATRMPTAFQLQYSDDGTTWTTSQSFSGVAAYDPLASYSFSPAGCSSGCTVVPPTTTPTPTPTPTPTSAATSSDIQALTSAISSVVQSSGARPEVIQAETILFGVALGAVCSIWALKRLYHLFNTHNE